MSLIARPSDLVHDEPTWSIAAGAINALYPQSNLHDRLAHTVARASGTTITHRATFGGAQTLQAIALIHTDATAVQITNGAGLNQAMSIPTEPQDGLPLDPWIDLRLLANTSSTQWNIALTGPSGVGVGEILLVETLREIQILLQPAPEEREAHGSIRHRTDYGVFLKFGFGVRQRAVRGSRMGETARSEILALQRDARGGLRNFLLIIDDDRNDALYVDLEEDERAFGHLMPLDEEIAEVSLIFREQQKGLALS